MKNVIKKIIVIGLALLLAGHFASAIADAASTVSVTGGDNVTGGETFTVTVTFDGDSIGRVSGDVTYDTEMLSYISGGSSSGNVGYVELKKAGTGEALTFELKFQALKEGSTELTVSTSEMYDLGEMFMDTPSVTKTVSINGNAADDQIIKETNPEDDAAEEGLSVDEKEDTPEEPSDDSNSAEDVSDDSAFIGKAIMLGVAVLVLILLVVALIRRKK